MGYFVAGEGRRLYGKTTTSAVPNRQAMVVRQPLGVAGLIIAANTPIANVAWKVFPALVCGNAAVLKASEDTPETALAFARLAAEAGLPPGVLNVVHGYGEEAGQPLVEHSDVAVVSFTGSTAVGRMIARVAGERLAKVCLELGGKNPFVVCDDADLEKAADAAALSAFSNAGQRCAAGSRLIVFDAVYDDFVSLLARANGSPACRPGRRARLRPGDQRAPARGDAGRRRARARRRSADPRGRGAPHRRGSRRRLLHGPHAGRERVARERDRLHRALRPDRDDPPGRRLRGGDRGANASPYGLTAAIWTASVHRGQEFVAQIQSGVASVNGPTYGSEPHMPFGGVKDSGTGWREAGTEAIDVYSDLKTVYLNHDPSRV